MKTSNLKSNKEDSLILGINACRRLDGVELRDGSACAIHISKDDVQYVAAIQEERLSRRRYDQHSIHAVKYCMPFTFDQLNGNVIVGFSSALDAVWSESQVRNYLEQEYGLKKVEKVYVVGHHDSHAFEAFATSPFDNAIIVVIDSMGNKLNPEIYGENSWETQTYYIGHRSSSGKISLRLLRRECTNKPGYGQLFRAVTRYVGFPGYHHASKVMAIAGIGKKDQFRKFNLPHSFQNNELLLSIDLDPDDLYSPINKWLSKQGYPDHPPRNEEWYNSDNFESNGRKSLRPLDVQLSLAVQLGYEEFLITRVHQLVADTGINNVCIGGGCALNCVANARLLESEVCKNVYVGSSPSDAGQGLGNALFALNKKAPELIRSIKPPYLGKSYDESSIIKTFNDSKGFLIKKKNINQYIAKELSLGKIIALFNNKSEYGPRALGNRSIIASTEISKFPEILEKLRKIKRREDYQPFAVSIIIDERCKDTVDLPSSPYMSFAPILSKGLSSLFFPIIHDDGTCRIQTVTESQNPSFFNIIWNYYLLTGIPGIINTSLNLRGEPIVENPQDLKSLWEREHLIDILVINDYFISR